METDWNTWDGFKVLIDKTIKTETDCLDDTIEDAT